MKALIESGRVLLARLHGHLRRAQSDRELDEELASHLAMAEEEYLRRGRTPEEAKRLARVDLGGVTQLREACREVQGLSWLDAIGLDLRLAFRTLRRSWGLTLVGGLAMTVAMSIGAGAFNLINAVMGAALPLDAGDRVVALLVWDARENRRQGVAPADLARWRESLRLVEDVGGFRDRELPMTIAGVTPSRKPVRLAEISASGFELARVPPLLGRTLTRDDERAGAPAVVVIGHEVWRSQFASDPGILGRKIRLGVTEHEVVGVMPEGFAFPVDYSYWTALNLPSMGPASSPSEMGLMTFARLRDGVGLEAAQAELATVGLTPALYSRTDPPPVLRVSPYPLAFVAVDGGDKRWVMGVVLLLAGLLLLPPCANVAILVYARTVARREEISLRYVLGASRGRIVIQLFAEVLALSLVSALAAVGVIRLGGLYVREALLKGSRLPFWIDFERLPVSTLLLTLALAVMAAAIAGVGPALRATGDLAHAGAKSLGRGTGPRLGATWTGLIVAQVALAIAVLPSAASMAWGALRPGILGQDFPAGEYVVGKIAPMEAVGPTLRPGILGQDTPAGEHVAGIAPMEAVGPTFLQQRREFLRSLRAQNGLGPVALSQTAPGREAWGIVALMPGSAAGGATSVRPEERPLTVSLDSNSVDEAYFEAYQIRPLAGRGFEPADFEGSDTTPSTAVIVSRTLAAHLARPAGSGDLDGILGRRLRYLRTASGPAPEFGPVYEVVGVVSDLPDNLDARVLYHPLPRASDQALTLSVRQHGMGEGGLESLWRSAAPFASTLRLSDLRPLDDVYEENERDDNLSAYILAAATLSVLLLSAAGINALMSFTISRKRREIGIRSALGARPHQLLREVLRQASAQVGLGAVAGMAAALGLSRLVPVDELGGRTIPGMIPAAALIMMTVGVLAAIGPARRGLRVEPTEALREG